MGENKEAFMSHCECVLWRRILKENAKFSPKEKKEADKECEFKN